MKAAIILAGAVIFLAACNTHESELQNPARQAGDCSRLEAIATRSLSPSYSPLPEEIVLTKPFHVRGDRIYTTPKGATRRLATLEILEGDAATIGSEVGDALLQSGFRTTQVPEMEDGVTRLAFVKQGYGRINIYAQSDVGSDPYNPAAVGIVKFDWPIQTAAADEQEVEKQVN